MKRIVFSFFCIFFSLQSFGQIISVGNGTDTSSVLPFNPQNWTQYSQQIILANEINADSTSKYITDIVFHDISQRNHSSLLTGMTILMGNTSLNSLSQGYISHSQMTVVRASSIWFSQNQGNKYQIHLDNPFLWDKVSNIVMTIIKNPGMSASYDSWGFYSQTTIDSLSMYDIGASNYSLNSPPSQGILTNLRPNYELYMIGCFQPDSIRQNKIYSNSVDISLYKKGGANSWEIEYKPQSDTIWNSAISFFANDTNIIINNLIENTKYDIRVRSVCSQWNKSDWVEAKFKTSCSSISVFPFTENFIGNECWVNIKNSSFSALYDGGQFYGALLSGYSSNAYLVSPQLNTDLDSLMVSFEAINGNGILIIGVMSDLNDTNSFHPLCSIPNPLGKYIVNLNSLTLQGVNNYLGFKAEVGSVIIKSITIDKTPQCPDINNLHVRTISPTSILLNWDRYNDIHNGFQIAYNQGSTFDTNIAIIINLNDTINLPYLLDSLLPSTQYSIGVRQKCGGNWAVKNEKTYSLPAQLPFFCDFEDSIVSNSWTFSNNKNGYFEVAEDFDSINQKLLKIKKTDTINNYPSTIVASRFIELSGASGYKLTFKTKVKNINWAEINYVKVYFSDKDTLYDGLENTAYYSDQYFNKSLIINNRYHVMLTSSGEYSVDLPYLGKSGNIKKIIFVVYSHNTQGSSMGLDDIKMEERHCVPPVLSVDSLSANSASLSWIKGIYDNDWWLYYKKSTDTKYDSIFITNTNTHTISGLSQYTLYKAYSVLVCDSNKYSNIGNIVEFRTECEKIDTLPFIEKFDSYISGNNSYMTCWSKISNTSYPYILSSDNIQYLYFSASKNRNSYAITPQLSSNIPIDSTMLRFKIRTTKPTTYLVIGAMSNVNDLTTFDSITSISPDTVQKWQWFEVKLNNYNGTGKYIVLKSGDSVNNHYLHIDDFSIDKYLSCSNVPNFIYDSITRNSVNLRWDIYNSSGQGYQVSYQKTDSIKYPNSVTIININDSILSFPYIINGLEPFTSYRIGVRQNCGGLWNYQNIKTNANPINLPYYCDFSDSIERSSWVISNGNAPNAWVIGQAVNKMPISGYSLYVSNDNGISNIYWAGQSIARSSTIVASRLFNSNGSSGYVLSFNSRLGGSSLDYLKVFVVDEDTVFIGGDSSPYFGRSNYSKGTVLYGGDNKTNSSNPYFYNYSYPDSVNNHKINIPYLGPNGTVKKIIFVWENNNYAFNQPPASIDNISIVENKCAPIMLKYKDLTSNSVSFNWLSSISDTSWYLYIKKASDVKYDSIHIISNPKYTLYNLLPNTTYNAYVKIDCSNVYVNSGNIVSFQTFCNAISSIPYVQNFDTYNSQYYFDCWRRILSSSTEIISVTTGYQGTNCVRFSVDNFGQSVYAILPLIDSTIAIDSLYLKFRIRNNSNYIGTNKLVIGTMSDISDANSFDSITSVISTNSLWEDRVVFLNSFSGKERYIVLKFTNDNNNPFLYIDDLIIDKADNCFVPTNLRASIVMQDSVKLSWDAIINPIFTSIPSCWLFYKLDNDLIFDSIQVSTSPYTLSGLMHSKYYNIYIKYVCAPGYYGNSDTIKVQTLCGAISSFPYYEGFDEWTQHGLTYPICWSSYNTPLIVKDYTNSNSYSLSLYRNVQTSYSPTIAISPMINENINLLKVKFNLKKLTIPNNSKPYKLAVGIMSDRYDTSTFENVYLVDINDTLNREYEVMFNSTLIGGDSNYIAFKACGLSYSYIIDNVVIDYIPQCAQPSNLALGENNLYGTEINCTPRNPYDNAWWLYYKSSKQTKYDSVHVTSIPYTLNGLNQVSLYDIYIKTDCGTVLSNPSNSLFFCTPIFKFPYIENFDSTAKNTLPLSWGWISSNPVSRYPFVRQAYLPPSSPNSLFLYPGGSGYVLAVSPQIDSLIPMKNLSLSFKMKLSASDSIVVGSLVNRNDITSFDTIKVVKSPSMSTWNTFNVDFNSYNGDGHNIALLVHKSAQVDIDDFIINNVPANNPKDLVINNVTDSSATFSWSRGGNENLWEVTLDTTTILSQSIDTNFLFNNLQASISYTAYVRSLVFPDTSNWVSISFTTLSNPISFGQIITLDPIQIDDSSAILSGRLISLGKDTTNINLGFLLHNQADIVLTTDNVINIPIHFSDTIDFFNYRANNLYPDSIYYYNTYFTNDAGTVYGGVKQFKTLLALNDIKSRNISISLFPNPASNNVKLEINNLNEDASVAIFDQQGRIMVNHFYKRESKGLDIDVKSFSSGIYHVLITSDHIRKTLKLIINN